MKILVLDNYDSFTYNLVHLVQKIVNQEVDVLLNDQVRLEDVQSYDKIILSPGPGLPKDAGHLLTLIRNYASSKSILGVCLGHQAIGEAFGGQLLNLSTVYHGVSTTCELEKNSRGLFDGLPGKITVGRYHSWIVNDAGFPGDLQVIARDENGFIMALQHKTFDVQGVQFHPESVLTPDGEKIVSNWLLR